MHPKTAALLGLPVPPGEIGTADAHPLLPAELQHQYQAKGIWEGQVLYEFVRKWAEGDPDRVAIRGDKQMTYAELWSSARSVAAAFQSVGLAPRDVLLAVLPSSWRGVVLEVAASIAGLLFVPRSHRTTSTLAFNLATQLGVKCIVVDTALAETNEWQQTIQSMGNQGVERVFITSSTSTPTNRPSLDDMLLADPSAVKIAEPQSLAPTIVLATGGTTGTPKSIVHGSDGLVFACREFARATAYTSHDVHVAIAPYGHAGGSVFEVYMPLIHGASILPIESWKPAEVVDAIEKWGGTFFITMGTHIFDLLQLDDDHVNKLKTMRLATSGAGPNSLFLEGERRLGFPLVRVYGFSEMPGHAIGRISDPSDVRLLHDGIPFRAVECRIGDSLAHPPTASAAPSGPYACRGPNLFYGYAGQAEMTHSLVSDEGFYSPGDLVRKDTNGYFSWTGRTRDIIRRGGLQIDPIELEDLLSQHPAFSEVVVVPYPHKRLSEVACIVGVSTALPRPDLEMLSEHLDGHGIPRQNHPEMIRWVDTLKRTELGKYDRASIRRSILGGAEDE